MTQVILNLHHWISLPPDVRYRIRDLFQIPRSSSTIVNDGQVETDGTTVEDFKHLSIEKMQRFVKSTSDDFHKLFDLTVAKVMEDIENKVQTKYPTEEVIINANIKTNAKSKKSKQE